MIQEDVRANETHAALGPRELSSHYRALADATRLRIIRALWRRREGTVTDLCEELRVSQPLMSWHLRILRRAGLVTTYRSGRQVHCAVNTSALEENGTILISYLAAGSEVDLEIAPVGSSQ